MVDSNPVPYISYYGSSSVRPKIAYWNSSESIANATSIEGAVNETFTTNWEVSIVPSSSKISLDHINVGVWKDSNGNLTYSTMDGNVPNGSNVGTSSAGTEDGTIYGNGSKNPILGYAVSKSASGFIETVQMDKSPLVVRLWRTIFFTVFLA